LHEAIKEKLVNDSKWWVGNNAWCYLKMMTS
jgi:hypothetical protein